MEIGLLSELKVLDCWSSGISSLPESIVELLHLENFNLRDCHLRYLPAGICRLINLRDLVLEGNPLEELPERIGLLKNVRELNLTNSRLKALPGSIGQMTGLEKLRIEWSRLTCLPQSIGELQNLVLLEIRHGETGPNPPSVIHQVQLKDLNSTENKLTELPESICCKANLSIIGHGQTTNRRKKHAFADPHESTLLFQPKSPLLEFEGGELSNSIRFITFSPDGEFLFVNADNGESKIWNVADWTEKMFDSGLRAGGEAAWRVKTAAFSPTSKLLACIEGESDDFIKIWDLQKSPASVVMSVRTHDFNSHGFWHGLVWSADGETLISRGPQSGLQFTNKEGAIGNIEVSVAGAITGATQNAAENNQWYWIKDIACFPDGKSLATISTRGVGIWAIPEGEELRWLNPPEPVNEWEFLPYFGVSSNGKHLAATLRRAASKATNYDTVEVIKIWNTSNWTEVVELQGQDTDGKNFRFRGFSPDDRLIVTTAGSTWNNRITIWDATTGEKLNEMNTDSVKNVVFGPKSNMLLTGGHSYLVLDRLYDVNVWDATTGELSSQIIDRTISTTTISPDGTLVVTGDGHNMVKIWKIRE
ncbi:MAG: hypothetical protein R3C11_26560 [Planctomycetaceae bacterium]